MYKLNSKKKGAQQNIHVGVSLLVAAGDIETNPGPGRKPKFPCGICQRAVKNSDAALECDSCNSWIHNKCSGVTDDSYNLYINMQCFNWICPSCEVLNFASSFFSIDQIDVTNPFDSLSDIDCSQEKFSPRVSSTPINDQKRGGHADTTKKRSFVPKFPNSDCDPNLTNCSSAESETKPKVKPSKTNIRKKTCKGVRVCIINCRSIKRKSALLDAFVALENPDVIIGTESWIDDSIKSSEVFPANFTVYRRDRNINGGGVFIAVKDGISSIERGDLQVDGCEILWCQLSFKNKNDSIFVGAYYRTPDSYKPETLRGLEESLQKLKSGVKVPFIVLGGDFNIPGMEWKVDDVTYPLNRIQSEILNIAQDYNLDQRVDFPTRKDPVTGVENILDLLFTTRPSLIKNVHSNSGLSDHTAVVADVDIKASKTVKAPRIIFRWNDVDETEFVEAVSNLQTDFMDSSPQTCTVEENWNFFKDGLTCIINKLVPQKTARGRPRPSWLTTDLVRQCRKKERCYVKAVKSGSTSDWENFKALQKEVSKQVRGAKRSHLQEMTSTENPRQFWRFINSSRKDNSGVQVLKVNDTNITSDRGKADALANQFSSVFTKASEDDVRPDLPPSPYADMPDIIVSTEGVAKLLRELNTSKAVGPDEIANKALKLAADVIAPILQVIFQQSLDSGILPSDWKKANVTPLFKKGSRSEPSNYRPVSLTSVSCKILEHVIDSQLMKHIENNKILNENQHAFRKGLSCESQLVMTMEDLTNNLDNNITTDIAVLDFSKAFDVVPHGKLIQKLGYYGVRGKVQNWIKAFLTGRLQRVVVNGEASKWHNVESGVPQGTVLGPHLFLLFINDINHAVRGTTRLFADDCLLYNKIQSSADELLLQNDLNTLVNWAETWGMKFNPSKCNIMRVSRKRNRGNPSYSMMGVNLEEKSEITYLGINIQSNLSWNSQTQHAVSKASRILNFIMRNFHPASKTVKEKLYTTLVRPHLEYGSVAWSPHLSKNIAAIEKVQRRAARFVCGDFSKRSSVSKMLADLKWSSLEERRESNQLTYLYKIINNVVFINPPVLKPKISRLRRGNSVQFDEITAKTDTYLQSFLPKTVRKWNKLPQEIVSAPNHNQFRAKI